MKYRNITFVDDLKADAIEIINNIAPDFATGHLYHKIKSISIDQNKSKFITIKTMITSTLYDKIPLYLDHETLEIYTDYKTSINTKFKDEIEEIFSVWVNGI